LNLSRLGACVTFSMRISFVIIILVEAPSNYFIILSSCIFSSASDCVTLSLTHSLSPCLCLSPSLIYARSKTRTRTIFKISVLRTDSDGYICMYAGTSFLYSQDPGCICCAHRTLCIVNITGINKVERGGGAAD